MDLIINGQRVSIGGSYIAGEGIDIQDGVISAQSSVKFLSKEEYDTLSEEQKQADILYIVDEPQWVPASLSIQEYDTEDGWHVRKWRDGYVEMFLEKQEDHAGSWSYIPGTNSLGRRNWPMEHFLYPFPLVKKYEETMSILINESTGLYSTSWSAQRDDGSLTKTAQWDILSLNDGNSVEECRITIRVTGRWK